MTGTIMPRAADGRGRGGPDRSAGRTGLRISPPSVRLSAFYRVEEGFVLRIYECAGEATEAAVELPREFAEARRTDLNLEPMQGEARLEGVTSGTPVLRVPLRAWEIATVALRV